MDDYHSYIKILTLIREGILLYTMEILWIILIIFLDAIFFAYGSALQEITVGELEKMDAKYKKFINGLIKLIDKPSRFINTLQFIFIISIFFTVYFIRDVSFIVYPFVIIFYLSFAIILPKKIGSIFYLKTLKRFEFIIRFFILICSPFTYLSDFISVLILKIFRLNDINKGENITQEDIMSLVNEGHEKGVLKSLEAQMITNIFDISDRMAYEIMVHRKNIISLSSDLTLNEAVSFMLEKGINTRYPVYDENIDNILGIINMKDALCFARDKSNGIKKIGDIKGLLREVRFIPERRNIFGLFKEMQALKMQMVVIVDEYGQTAGILTLEDILEEIVGNIMDEYDKEEKNISKLTNNIYMLNGLVSLEELNETVDLNIDQDTLDSFETLNGYLISKLGHIPNDKEEFSIRTGRCVFDRPKIKNRVINRVRLTVNEDIEE